MLRDNSRAIKVMKEMGFTVEFSAGTARAILNLKEEKLGKRIVTSEYSI